MHTSDDGPDFELRAHRSGIVEEEGHEEPEALRSKRKKSKPRRDE